MTHNVPLLMEIGEHFQVNQANAALKAVEIYSDPDGYQTIARQQAIAFDAGRFVIKTQVSEGMFAHQFPKKVEIGKAPDGLINLRFGEPAENYQGGYETVTVLPNTPSEERLFLPPDDGFAYFQLLHLDIVALRKPILEALGVALITIPNPQIVQFVSERATFRCDDYETDETYVGRESTLHIVDESGDLTNVVLDGSIRAPIDISHDAFESFRDLMMYRSGTVYTSRGRKLDSFSLSSDSLLAFGALHATVKQLYA